MKVSNKTKQDSVTTIPKSKGHRHPKQNKVAAIPRDLESPSLSLHRRTCVNKLKVGLDIIMKKRWVKINFEPYILLIQ